MRIAPSIRLTWLETKAIAKALGVFPVSLGVLFVLAALAQEPSIFREEGLELAWPSLIATSDFLFLVVLWVGLKNDDARGGASVFPAFGGWLVGSGVGLSLTLVELFYGLTGHPAVALDRVASFALRLVAVWLPIAYLANRGGQRRGPVSLQMAMLVAAYLMQASLFPASLEHLDASSLLALSPCPVLALLVFWPSGHGSQHLKAKDDADRNPR